MATFLVYMLVFFALYFQVFLLVTFLERRKGMKSEEDNLFSISHYPSVTIIVPCFNEEKTLSRTVMSLLSLDYPKDKLKISIVDDGSTDNTWNVIQSFKDCDNVSIFKKENGGKHTALNHALTYVNTDLVGCLDADSFVSKDTLKKIVKYFEDETAMAVTPAIKIENPKKILELVQNAEYNFGIFFKKMLGGIDSIQVAPGPFSIFRKKVFEDLGPYKKAHNTEDLEIAFRMQESNYKIVNSHKAFVHTVAPKTLVGLYKQRLRWVHGFLENSIDYKHLFFRKKYGNFGLFVLPSAVLSVFSVLYLISFMLLNIVNYTTNKFIYVKTVGIEQAFSRFSWFFIDSNILVFLSIIVFIFSLFMVMAGKSIAEDNKKAPIDVIYFMLIYGLIVPTWLFMAVYNTAFSRKNNWR